jgi:Ca2+-binding EF-hand superfamily protein
MSAPQGTDTLRSFQLSRLVQEELPAWDKRRFSCCAYLLKKAGKGKVSLQKGRYQERWFVLKTLVSPSENYVLQYYRFASDDVKFPRKVYDLAKCKLNYREITGDFDLLDEFGYSVLTCRAENKNLLDKWAQTLKIAIDVATKRFYELRERREENTGITEKDPWKLKDVSDFVRGKKKINIQLGGFNITKDDDVKEKHPIDDHWASIYDRVTAEKSARVPHRAKAEVHTGSKRVDPITRPDEDHGVHVIKAMDKTIFHMEQRSRSPLVRLDMDIQHLPPSSTQRHQFEEMFRSDVTKALQLDEQNFFVEVISIRPAPGAAWLTIVEFDVYITMADEEYTPEVEARELLLEKKREEYLDLFTALLKDTRSILHHGFVTCKLDPNFMKNFPHQPLDAVELFSTEQKVMDVMAHYSRIYVPPDELDFSYFNIYLSFEGKIVQMPLPNPRLFPRHMCFLFPYEVKAAFGLMNTMQEIWIEPVAIVPMGLPVDLSFPILFNEAASIGGTIGINCTHLKAGLTYEVQMEDMRAAVIETLTKKEREEVKQVFEKYDLDNSGTLSVAEVTEIVRDRVAARKDIIDAKFDAFAKECTGLDLQRAEEARLMYYQQLTENQSHVLKKFHQADADGNGELSFTEFLLAEAWWLRCTLNPSKAHLF